MKHHDFVNPRVKNLMDVAGFGHLLTFTHTEINPHLVTALVE